MCGVMGYAAKGGGAMDLDAIKRIAAATMARGPHSFGFAWIDSKDRLKMFKQAGRIVDHLGLLSMARDAKMLIGHCRYATHGSPSNNLNNHPHPVDGGWFVHNGVVGGHERLIEKYRLKPVTECDSEVIGLIAERAKADTLFDRMRIAVKTTPPAKLVVLGLWNRPRRMVAIRRGNPLSLGITDGGYYFGSLAAGLPGDVQEIEDGSALQFSPSKVEYLPL
jgi:glucosamine--fructose-6-phosphate aminotransferase (isomerizing)